MSYVLCFPPSVPLSSVRSSVLFCSVCRSRRRVVLFAEWISNQRRRMLRSNCEIADRWSPLPELLPTLLRRLSLSAGVNVCVGVFPPFLLLLLLLGKMLWELYAPRSLLSTLHTPQWEWAVTARSCGSVITVKRSLPVLPNRSISGNNCQGQGQGQGGLVTRSLLINNTTFLVIVQIKK